MRERRDALGGDIPARRRKAAPLEVPPLSAFESSAQGLRRGQGVLHDHGLRAPARGVAQGQAHRQAHRAHRRRRVAHLRHGRVVPQLGIWSQQGQLYTPQDRDQLMFYKEDASGQILQEGINEAGAVCSWIAAATVVFDARRADDPVLHLLLDVRHPAHRGSLVGGRRLAARAAFCSAAPRAAPP